MSHTSSGVTIKIYNYILCYVMMSMYINNYDVCTVHINHLLLLLVVRLRCLIVYDAVCLCCTSPAHRRIYIENGSSPSGTPSWLTTTKAGSQSYQSRTSQASSQGLRAGMIPSMHVASYCIGGGRFGDHALALLWNLALRGGFCKIMGRGGPGLRKCAVHSVQNLDLLQESEYSG